MEIKDLYVASNQAEQRVVAKIAEPQWRLAMPEKITRVPMTLEEVVRYHIWDDAWLPDVLAGKAKETVGDAHEHLLTLSAEDLHIEFAAHNQRAIAAVRALDDLDRNGAPLVRRFPSTGIPPTQCQRPRLLVVRHGETDRRRRDNGRRPRGGADRRVHSRG